MSYACQGSGECLPFARLDSPNQGGLVPRSIVSTVRALNNGHACASCYILGGIDQEEWQGLVECGLMQAIVGVWRQIQQTAWGGEGCSNVWYALLFYCFSLNCCWNCKLLSWSLTDIHCRHWDQLQNLGKSWGGLSWPCLWNHSKSIWIGICQYGFYCGRVSMLYVFPIEYIYPFDWMI
jgi:hypothetical protein